MAVTRELAYCGDMKPSSRRRYEREIREIMANDGDNCSLCRRPLEANDRTFGGATKTGAASLVGECCVGKLKAVILGGVYVSPDFPVPKSWGKPDRNAVNSLNDVEQAVDAIRAAGVAMETERRKVASRAGIDPATTIMHTAASEWKDDDASWFAANPTRTHRLRAIIGGERASFGAIGNQNVPIFHELQVLVRQVEPGARVRLPFGRDLRTPIPDDDGILHAMFDVFSKGERGAHVSTADVARLATRAEPKGNA